MKHPDINTSAAELVWLLSELQLLREVKYTALPTPEELAALQPEAPNAPVALVSFERAFYRRSRVSVRDVDWVVTLAGIRPSTPEAQAAWDALVEEVVDALSGDTPNGLVLNGANWQMRSFSVPAGAPGAVLCRIRLRARAGMTVVGL